MKKLLLLGTVLLGTILGGCATGNGYYVSARLGPPPPPRYGMMGRAPGAGFVWTEGYWDQRGGSWYWVDGRWMRPPHARAMWVPSRWHQNGNHWRFERGHWR